jgi:4-amino-4-deoxy-L-arabinose transferase-like glycosyltransferase
MPTFRSFILYLSLALIIVLGFVRMTQEGMFFDGLIYASEARNFATGPGSFWRPFTGTVTYDHPPLFFALQGFFFRITGDSIYTERIYGILVFAGIIFFMIKIWKKVFSHDAFIKEYGIITVVVMLSFNTMVWGLPSNLLDTTVCLFDLVAAWCMLKSGPGVKRLWMLPAGIFISMAFFTKGFPGLGVLVLPACYYLFISRKKLSSLVYDYLAIGIPLGFTLAFILINKEADFFFRSYFNTQVLSSIQGKRETVSSWWGHLWIVKEIVFFEISIAAGLIIILRLLVKDTEIKPMRRAYSRQAMFFLAVAASCSLPIMISIKQRALYLMPSFPWYAFFLSVLLMPYLKMAESRLKNLKLLKKMNIAAFVALLAACGASIMMAGTVSRDEDSVELVHEIRRTVPYGSTIGIFPGMYQDFRLRAYLLRYDQHDSYENCENCNYFLENVNTTNAAYAETLRSKGFQSSMISKGFNLWSR